MWRLISVGNATLRPAPLDHCLRWQVQPLISIHLRPTTYLLRPFNSQGTGNKRKFQPSWWTGKKKEEEEKERKKSAHAKQNKTCPKIKWKKNGKKGQKEQNGQTGQKQKKRKKRKEKREKKERKRRKEKEGEKNVGELLDWTIEVVWWRGPAQVEASRCPTLSSEAIHYDGSQWRWNCVQVGTQRRFGANFSFHGRLMRANTLGGPRLNIIYCASELGGRAPTGISATQPPACWFTHGFNEVKCGWLTQE